MPIKCAVIAVSAEGLRTAMRLIGRGFSAQLYAPGYLNDGQSELRDVNWHNDDIHTLTKKIIANHDGLVYIMPMGIVVRAIAPYAKDKHSDPAVVTVDVGGRWAIATLSGHEGGANELAASVARYLRGEPVITTSTEAVKTLIAGIGCGKGVSADVIESAVDNALRITGHTFDELRLVATVDAKEHEEGLLTFCISHGLPLRVISREEIKAAQIRCNESEYVKKTLGIGAVAEPCALLGGSKTELILEKQASNRVTVALAVEHCEW
jgi:cobalt-precorrin 5A hydrolase